MPRSLAEYLSEAFVKADFDFFLGVLSGQKEQKPRWKRRERMQFDDVAREGGDSAPDCARPAMRCAGCLNLAERVHSESLLAAPRDGDVIADRCLAKVNAYLPEALGQMYVERVFPADAKARHQPTRPPAHRPLLHRTPAPRHRGTVALPSLPPFPPLSVRRSARLRSLGRSALRWRSA